MSEDSPDNGDRLNTLPRPATCRIGRFGPRGSALRRRARYGHLQLFQIAQVISAELDFDKVFGTIIEQVCMLLNAERSSIFLIDECNENLRAFFSLDLKQHDFKIPKHKGIAGQAFCRKKAIIVNRPYESRLFNPAVDRRTGFITRNIISVPLISRSRDCIGTLQALNKRDGDFTLEDQRMLIYVSSFCAAAVENSLLYEEVKANALSRGKAVDHLAHEIKTPLAVISAAFDRISSALTAEGQRNTSAAIARGRRNIDRLLDLQEKVNDILRCSGKEVDLHCADVISELDDLVEEMTETNPGLRKACSVLIERLKKIHLTPVAHVRDIRLEGFIQGLVAKTAAQAQGRSVELRTEVDPQIIIRMDGRILNKICTGLLKNAFENTPDGGLIRMTARMAKDGHVIEIQDCGTGITAENQKLIFHGFFHTQDTALYSSKRPYAFNAGGAGADLLRIRRFAEHFKFKIDFRSIRCRYLPTDTDVCCGRVSECRHIACARECNESGGTTFTLHFLPYAREVCPLERIP